MKVLNTISSLNIYSGGPSLSVYLLVKELRAKGIDAEILSFGSKNSKDKVISTENFIKTIDPPANLRFGYSNSFSKFLKEDISTDIYHGHGLWQLPVHYMCRASRQKIKPYVISPRGMLEPWSLEQSKFKKKLALWFYQYKDIANASCIHATAKMEAENIRKLGLSNPIAVIPNGLNLSEFPAKEQSRSKEIRTILFLSRIHPKKGIELLIEAWAKIEKEIRNGWVIKIAGNGEPKYINSLTHLIKRNNLENEIEIIGAKFGEDKLNMYQKADLFVLPTYSENFGMVVAEALACGVPVITTKGAPWEELNTHNAGWWIDIGVEPLTKALTEAMQLSDGERKQIGLNGRKLIEKNYSIESVAQKMIQLYEWILYKKEKPGFVLT
ncbi:MAG: glycosyl transferase family 1 [Candidatus Parcubacteria bacterium]|nr:MAG: glycosyl transferase family 1 [Candidatus Parcubacteria bacterium]